MLNLRGLPDLEVDLVVEEAERHEREGADEGALGVAAEHHVGRGLVQVRGPVVNDLDNEIVNLDVS